LVGNVVFELFLFILDSHPHVLALDAHYVEDCEKHEQHLQQAYNLVDIINLRGRELGADDVGHLCELVEKGQEGAQVSHPKILILKLLEFSEKLFIRFQLYSLFFSML